MGSGHQFDDQGSFSVTSILTYSGSLSPAAYNNQHTTTVDGGGSPGSITPEEDNELLVFAVGALGAGIDVTVVDTGPGVVEHQSGLSGQVFGSAVADLIQTTATAVNPTFTISGGGRVVKMAAFRAQAGGGAAPAPSVFDATTVTEAITVLLQKLPITVSDTVTLTEISPVTVSAVGTVSPNVVDSVSVTESAALNLNLAPSVFDGVVVTEQPAALLPFLVPGVSDTVTLTESVAARSLLQPSVSDVVTVTESATALLPSLVPSVFDAVTVIDEPQVIIVSAGVLPIGAFDAVTITENVSVVLKRLTLEVFDEVTVTELAQASGSRLTPSALDAVTVTEISSVLLPFLAPSAFDTITTSDDVQVVRTLAGVLPISALDSITVTESVSAFLPILVPSAFDLVEVTDRAIMIGEVLVGPGETLSWLVEHRDAVWFVRGGE